MSTMLFVHVPHQHLGQFGPFSCSKGIDELGVVQYARTLLDSTAQLHDRRQKLANYDIWIELPKIPDQYKDRHVLLLFKRGPTVHVYVVGMERDTISERKIRNFLGSIYGVRCDSLSMCEGEQQDQNPSEIAYHAGSILSINAKCISLPANDHMVSLPTAASHSNITNESSPVANYSLSDTTTYPKETESSSGSSSSSSHFLQGKLCSAETESSTGQGSSSSSRDSPLHYMIPTGVTNTYCNTSQLLNYESDTLKLHNALKEPSSLEPEFPSTSPAEPSDTNLKMCERSSIDIIPEQLICEQKPVCESAGHPLQDDHCFTPSKSSVEGNSSDKHYLMEPEQLGFAVQETVIEQEGRVHCQETDHPPTASQEEESRADQSTCQTSNSKECGKSSDECHCTSQEQHSGHHLSKSCDHEGKQNNHSTDSPRDARHNIHSDHIVQPQPVSRIDLSHSQGTPPGEGNPIVCESKNNWCLFSTNDCFVGCEVNTVHKQLNGDASKGAAIVCNNKMYVAPNSIMRAGDREEDHTLSQEDDMKGKLFLTGVQLMYGDRVLIYCSKAFNRCTGLSHGTTCEAFLPSPPAVQKLQQRKVFPFAASMVELRHGLPDHDSWMLPPGSFLGSGGNGITFEHILRGQKYAIKWVSPKFKSNSPYI